MSRPRLAILRDFPEENWPSMDLVAEMLFEELRGSNYGFDVRMVCPPFKRRATLLPVIGRNLRLSTFDRLVNRVRDYPRYLRQTRDEFELFHVTDHSYAAAVHALPSHRTGVFCHDLDAFAAILRPEHRRPAWYRVLVRHILRGLQKAAIVFHPTQTAGRLIAGSGLIDPARLVHAPLGCAAEFTPENDGQPQPDAVRNAMRQPYILHVGNCAHRKRMDVLIDVFAELRQREPELRLVKVGEPFHSWQQELIHTRKVGDAIVHLNRLNRSAIAALYRNAAAVLMPSESEGFGLPTIEALACAAPVVASDVPVFREVGADAIRYCGVGDVQGWATTVHTILRDPNAAPPRQKRLARAAEFTWARHASIIADAYHRLRG